jgi:hypothetical protein
MGIFSSCRSVRYNGAARSKHFAWTGGVNYWPLTKRLLNIIQSDFLVKRQYQLDFKFK